MSLAMRHVGLPFDRRTKTLASLACGGEAGARPLDNEITGLLRPRVDAGPKPEFADRRCQAARRQEREHLRREGERQPP